MLDRTDHLLIKLMEECAEIQQAASKALLFGLDDGYPDTDRTNKGDLNNELNDLFAVIEMLTDSGLSLKPDDKRIEAKKLKVEHWMVHSKGQGRLSV